MIGGARVLAVVLARLGSSRLPGKMLLPFAGHDNLVTATVERMRASRSVDEFVFATTTETADTPLAERAAGLHLEVVRGSQADVVGRMVQAMNKARQPPDVVVRVCCDNPLVMPTLVDDAVAQLLLSGADVVTYAEQQTLPFGLSMVVMTAQCLRRIDAEAKAAVYREHVENFCLERTDLFRVVYQKAPHHLYFPELSLTLDTAVDLARLSHFHSRIADLPLPAQPAGLVAAARHCRTLVLRDTPSLDPAIIGIFLRCGLDAPTLSANPPPHPSFDLVLMMTDRPPPPGLTAPRGVIGCRRDAVSGGWRLCDLARPDAPAVFHHPMVPGDDNPTLASEAVFLDLLPLAARSLVCGPLRPIAPAAALVAADKDGGGNRLGFPSTAAALFPQTLQVVGVPPDRPWFMALTQELKQAPSSTRLVVVDPSAPPQDDVFLALSVDVHGTMTVQDPRIGWPIPVGNRNTVTVAEAWSHPLLRAARADLLNAGPDTALSPHFRIGETV
ncbi:MAG: NTP transferase domain-containing protein [Magnetospirillum sp.]